MDRATWWALAWAVGGPVAPSFRRAPGTLSIRWAGWRRTGAFWGRGSQPLSDSAAGQLQGALGSWA